MITPYAPIPDAIKAFAAGQLLIVVDSEDRENEGDFVVAAEHVTPEIIHFMISQGRGQLCMPVLPEIAERLELPLMVTGAEEEAPHFTVPIDHVTCKTGISPWERSYTVRTIIDPTSRAEDFYRPGHIFPLLAREEGVLRRPGHTESAIDLARLAGLTPAGILCEICSRDGRTMADQEELFEIAEEHHLLVLTIDDLIVFRRQQTSLDHWDAGSNEQPNCIVAD